MSDRIVTVDVSKRVVTCVTHAKIVVDTLVSEEVADFRNIVIGSAMQTIMDEMRKSDPTIISIQFPRFEQMTRDTSITIESTSEPVTEYRECTVRVVGMPVTITSLVETVFEEA